MFTPVMDMLIQRTRYMSNGAGHGAADGPDLLEGQCFGQLAGNPRWPPSIDLQATSAPTNVAFIVDRTAGKNINIASRTSFPHLTFAYFDDQMAD